jgi:hypothetical protein
MKREEVIKLIMCRIKLVLLQKVIAELAQLQTKNYSLQLLHQSLQYPCDKYNSWFTALAVLCINQRVFASNVLQGAYLSGGNKPMSRVALKELVDAISAGAKLTKADAG